MSIFPSNDKNKQVLQLLFSHKEFDVFIDEIREELQLATVAQRECWSEHNDAKLQEYIMNPDIRKKEKSIHEMYRNGDITKQEHKKQLKELQRMVPMNNLKYFTEKILDKFNLPKNFKNSIQNYIIYKNDESFMSPSTAFSESFNLNKDMVTINIYRQLDTKELAELQKYIQRRTDHLPKYREMKDFDTKLELESAYKHRDQMKDGDGIYKNTEIAKDFLNDESKNKQVFDIVRGLKELRHTLFGSSENSS